MPAPKLAPNFLERYARLTTSLLICVVWLVVVAVAVARLGRTDGIIVLAAGLTASFVTVAVLAGYERARWRNPIKGLAESVRAVALDPGARARVAAAAEPELSELAGEISALTAALTASPRNRRQAPAGAPSSASRTHRPGSEAFLTRSGHFDAPPPIDDAAAEPYRDPRISGDYSTADMVNRLEPVGLRWIESSTAEQILLGWTLDELRQKSFLEAVHSDDRQRAKETFAQALARGEALGLVVRMRTAHGSIRAIEVNVGARYGSNKKVTHLRCHLTDVTDKVRSERALRLRTLELTRVNEQLRTINRELEELKDRYSDLYENAPAMYFSLDSRGVVIECNQTMLATLSKPREQVVGQPYESFLHASSAERFRSRFRELLERGSIETESRWLKAGGEVIDVGYWGSVSVGSKGAVGHARFVAQDVTARRRLEAELRDKNRRLKQANRELSERNRELDEFVYVVSHDLQEPLRTLITFSDFLSKDYGDRLEAEGQEFVRYLVDASRRMRAMILGMLNLARVGTVIGDGSMVNLEELIAVVRTDLGERFRSGRAELRVVGPLPPVWGDRGRIGQLLANLISNGIKYNRHPGPWVQVKAIAPAGGESGSDVTIAVQDNGIGIDPQFHATIFQLFRRLHTREEFDGTGVGLAICNKIVQAHGGRIWVDSALGEGATFYIRLPGARSSASTAAATSTTTASPLTDAGFSQVPRDEPQGR